MPLLHWYFLSSHQAKDKDRVLTYWTIHDLVPADIPALPAISGTFHTTTSSRHSHSSLFHFCSNAFYNSPRYHLNQFPISRTLHVSLHRNRQECSSVSTHVFPVHFHAMSPMATTVPTRQHT